MKNLLISFFISLTTSSFTQELELEKYNDNGINFEYPAEWIKESQKNGDVFFYPLYDFSSEKPFGVAISQIKEINSEESSTEAYLTLTLTSLKRFQKANVIKNEIKKINGLKAFIYEYEIKEGETHDLGKLLVFRKGPKAFQITLRGTFKSYMDYRMFAEYIINSFTIQ